VRQSSSMNAVLTKLLHLWIQAQVLIRRLFIEGLQGAPPGQPGGARGRFLPLIIIRILFA